MVAERKTPINPEIFLQPRPALPGIPIVAQITQPHQISQPNKAIQGVAITVVEERQAVFVNVVGNIKPEQVALLGERFDIEPLRKVGLAMNKK